jgi:hypothetical protein
MHLLRSLHPAKFHCPIPGEMLRNHSNRPLVLPSLIRDLRYVFVDEILSTKSALLQTTRFQKGQLTHKNKIPLTWFREILVRLLSWNIGIRSYGASFRSAVLAERSRPASRELSSRNTPCVNSLMIVKSYAGSMGSMGSTLVKLFFSLFPPLLYRYIPQELWIKSINLTHFF